METTNGNLASVPLGGAFCSATFRRRSGGLIDVDLGGNKLLTIQSMQTPTFSKNLTCIEKRFLAVKHWNLVEALLHDQFSNSEKLFIGQTVRYILITILRTEYKVNIALHGLHDPLIKIN